MRDRGNTNHRIENILRETPVDPTNPSTPSITFAPFSSSVLFYPFGHPQLNLPYQIGFPEFPNSGFPFVNYPDLRLPYQQVVNVEEGESREFGGIDDKEEEEGGDGESTGNVDIETCDSESSSDSEWGTD